MSALDMSRDVLFPHARTPGSGELRVLLLDDDERHAAELRAVLAKDPGFRISSFHLRSFEPVGPVGKRFDAIVVVLAGTENEAETLERVAAVAGGLPIVAVDGDLAADPGDVADLGVQQRLPDLCASCRRTPALATTLTWAVERHRLVRELERSHREERHSALHDDLTGLPNRRLYHERFDLLLAQACRTRKRLGLLLLDLDRFKGVNDELGHLAGDALLKEVGERLRRSVRATDTVARRGGDEFAVLLDDIRHTGDAVSTAQKLLASVSRPFWFEGRRIDPGASVGIAVCPEHGRDVATLERRADEALYAAKRAGGGAHRLARADGRRTTVRR